jgi:hypothetical protein
MPGTMRKDAIGSIANTRYAPIISKRSCYLILWIRLPEQLLHLITKDAAGSWITRDMPRPRIPCAMLAARGLLAKLALRLGYAMLQN